MSHSKVTISQSMNKIIYRHPENKTTNIPTNSHHIAQSSKTSRVLDESFQNSSKLHNTSGLEIRHFLNLLNITDEDRKNVPPKSQPKSPIKNSTSFVQQSTGSITKRGSPMKKPLLNYSPEHHKSFTNRSFISYPTESMNTLQEDKSIIDPPSPTFYNPSHSILNKRASMDGDRSFNAKTSNNQNYCRTARNSLLGGLDEVHSAKKVAKASTRPPSINTISGDFKKVNTSIIVEKTSKSKESSPFQKRSPINNNSMCSTQSMSILENIMKSFPEKGEVSGVRSGNKSPISTKQKRVSTEKIVNMDYQEGFNMKSVLEDVLDFPEKVKMMHNMIPKETYNKGSKTSHSKSPSNPRNTYNDLLNKKYGGAPQKAAMFDEPSHTNTGYKPSKQNIHGSLNEISESTILDMILNSTTTTIRTEKKKPVADGMYRKVVSSQILDSKSFIKEVSLDVMNQIPKGILVNKSLERKPKSTQFIKENPPSQQIPKPQEKPKLQEAYKSQEAPKSQEKPKTETRNRASTTRQKNTANVNTTKRTEEQKYLDLKESVISVDQSDDGLSLPSPLESKSMTSLVGQRRSSSTKPVERTEEKTPQVKKLTRGRSNAVAVLERSSSMRRAKKEEEMDGKCVKVRKENKEFVDLLNKISKNNHMEQIEAMFGKDEESLVKDLVEYIQNQNLTIGRARSNSYIKNMTILEKKIEEVRNKIPSLHNMFEEEEEKKNDSHADNKPASINHIPNSKEEEKSGFGKYKTKRSSFSLEAAKKIPPNTNASSINDIQNPDTSTMHHMLVPPSNQQENNLSTPSLGPLSLQNLHLDRKELLKLEDSARGPETKTDINIPHNKENNILDNKTNLSNKANSSDSEKRENTEVAIELPAFGRTSTLHTQESTSSSLITVAIETPPSSSKESGTLPLLDAVNDFEPKQENRLATSNIEPGLGSPSLLFSVLSGSSNNKPALPVVIAPNNDVKEQSSPPRNHENKQENNNDIMLKPTLQRSEFANGSFGCLPQPVEPTQTTQEPPKFGGLGSMVFKPPMPSPAVNSENPPKQQQQQGMNISMVVHLKKKLKPVYIEKLDPENLKATIYGEIQEKEHPGVSFGDLHDLFENAPVNKPTAAPAQPKKELKSLIIDGNRAQNISILAMKFRKLSGNELRDAIINLDPAIMTSEACSTLLPFVPLPDEIKACQNNKEPLEKLNTASQFLLNIYDIPQLGARLRSTIFKNEFKERFDTILNAINKVKTACDILKENIHFKVFLRLSLEVANTLNEGTTRGSALGLKPASLLSFDTVRSNKPGLTLLVYMAQKIFEQKPEILDFTADFGGIADATKINILDPIRGLQELKKDMNQLRLQLEMSMEKNPPDTGFSNAFKQFHDSSASLLIEAEENINKTNEHYMETAKFLGEDDDSLKKKTSMEFFKVFKHLADTIDKFKSDEVEKRKREARRAAMKK